MATSQKPATHVIQPWNDDDSDPTINCLQPSSTGFFPARMRVKGWWLPPKLNDQRPSISLLGVNLPHMTNSGTWGKDKQKAATWESNIITQKTALEATTWSFQSRRTDSVGSARSDKRARLLAIISTQSLYRRVLKSQLQSKEP